MAKVTEEDIERAELALMRRRQREGARRSGRIPFAGGEPYGNVLFDARLCERDFGRCALRSRDLFEWADSRKIAIPFAVPALDRFDLLHLESLLVAIEHGAGQHSSLAPIDLARGVETDPRIAEMASDDPAIAQWAVGAEVHRTWRLMLKHAIEHSELATVDALSGLPTAPVRSAPGAAAEQKDERQRRRLDQLHALGGNRVVEPGGGWKASGKRGALAALIREEAEAGRPYRDERDVRRDLDAEAERRKAGRTMPRG